MNNNTKKEFKSFIEELSTSITKDILNEDIKKMNKELDDIVNNLNNKSNYLKTNIDNLNKDINKINKYNKQLENIEDNIVKSNNLIDSSLDMMRNDYNVIINNILEKNESLMKEYIEDISYNKDEAVKLFNTELQEVLEDTNQIYIDRISQIGYIDNLNKLIEILESRLDIVETLVNNIDTNNKNIESMVESFNYNQEEINSNFNEFKNHVSTEINSLNNKLMLTDDNIRHNSSKIEKYLEKQDKNEKFIKIIFVMNIIILLLFLSY